MYCRLLFLVATNIGQKNGTFLALDNFLGQVNLNNYFWKYFGR